MIELEGLTAAGALEQLKKYGPNTIPEERFNPLAIFLKKFWAPVPWVLEIIFALEMTLGKFGEAWIIFSLLLFNAILSFFQEGRAKKALIALKQHLDVQARALRDKQWKLISAKELVPGDVIRIRMGDIVPADVKILAGCLSIDQSALTGESLPVEIVEGNPGYAGSSVKHGEAFANVIATGKHTYYGKTAEIVRLAKAPSHLERTIFQIIKYLVAFDLILVFSVFIYAAHEGLPFSDLIPFSLLLLVASVPVALPATFTLATALGSLELSKQGVLVSRLSAIEEAAAMNVLCLDKTGTITKNSLEVASFHCFSKYTKEDLFSLASLASEEATQDPIDLAILMASKNNASSFSKAEIIEFIPFDPERKCSEAVIRYANQKFHVFKGAPRELIKDPDLCKEIDKLAADGSRVIAVILKADQVEPVGLIALNDPPREDSKKILQELSSLGIRLLMITGDDAATARAIAEKVGLGIRILSRDDLYKNSQIEILDADIIAGVFPEDKFEIVSRLQKQGWICGMTGDGVNDAPALKKAEVGIAMSNATDVAKASAALSLTKPGLTDILEAIKTSRRIYQRMLTYTLNKIIKTLEISILLSIGIILINNLVISQALIVLLLFANDFLTMSIATDRVSYSQKPEQWNIKKLIFVGVVFATLILCFSFFAFFSGEKFFQLSIFEIRTLVFIILVFTGQATVYLVRERHHFWKSRPSNWMIASSLFDLGVVSFLAINGYFMAPLHASLVFGLFGCVLFYFVVIDFIKVKFFKIGRTNASM